MKTPLALLCLIFSATVYAQDLTVSTTAIKDGLYLLQGRGGNVLASVGEDGVLMVDDDYAQYAEAYKAALGKLSDEGPRYVLNTHWHGDHTGGNEFWGERGAVIVAHDNIYARMSTRQEMKIFGRVVEASPRAALPEVTFADSLALRFNGHTVEMNHLPSGHTDGDSVIYVVDANVVHMGDLFFKDRFPFVDMGSGGSVDGYLANVKTVLDSIDAETVIVPGHGTLADRSDLQRYLEMLTDTRAEVLAKLDQGMSVEEIQEQGLDGRWKSWGEGFINESTWIGFLAAGR